MKGSKVELLQRAQELIQAAIVLIEEATVGDSNTKAYLTDHLKILASEDHGFLSNDINLDKVMRKYENDDEEIEFNNEINLIMKGDF